MRWLMRLLGGFEPPTEKQLRFAKMLGISVTSRMSKQDVSDAIDRKKTADPKAFGKASGRAAQANRRVAAASSRASGEPVDGREAAWLKTPEGRAVVRSLKKWQQATEDEPYGIFVYRDPKTHRIEVDVAMVSQADLEYDASGQATVYLDVSLPTVTTDRGMAIQTLDWSNNIGWISAGDVLFWQKLPASFCEVDGCILSDDADASDRRQLRRYEAALQRGKQVTRQKRLR
jgi:hypothetical protein